MKLFSVFQQAVNEYASESSQIVLAFSGGLDSRVMLSLLSQYRDLYPEYQYLVIHVHHGLSEHADLWLSQCENWASEANFLFKGIKVCVKSQGQGVEQAARKARYQAIADNILPKALVLTAHHSDDQAETFLLALKRGSGVTGLAAMPKIRPFANATLFRPFLNLSREKLEAFAKVQQLEWIEDESNSDCRFDRNFIRQRWLKQAKARWPSITQAINRSAALCAEQEALLDELLAEHDEKIVLADGALAIKVLLAFSAKMQVALFRRWLKRHVAVSLSQVQIQQVFKSLIHAKIDAVPVMAFSDFQLRRFQQGLYLLPIYKDLSKFQAELCFDEVLDLPDGLGLLELNKYQSSAFALRAPFDAEKITVAFAIEGLTAHPVGRQGKRKLKKLYQEYNVPTWQRARTPLIFYADKLAAVAGLFVCQEFAGKDIELLWHKAGLKTKSSQSMAGFL